MADMHLMALTQQLVTEHFKALVAKKESDLAELSHQFAELQTTYNEKMVQVSELVQQNLQQNRGYESTIFELKEKLKFAQLEKTNELNALHAELTNQISLLQTQLAEAQSAPPTPTQVEDWKKKYDSLFEEHGLSEERHALELAELQRMFKEKSDQLQHTIEQQSSFIQQLGLEKERLSQALAQLKERVETSQAEKNEALDVHDKNLLHYAQGEVLRDEEIRTWRQKVNELTNLLQESEGLNRLHLIQVNALKEDIRSLERAQTRNGANMEYLKNIIIAYIESSDDESLVPVISTILQFSPEEMARVKAATQKPAAGFFGNIWGTAKKPTTLASPRNPFLPPPQ